MKAIDEDSPHWMGWRGRWGSSRAGVVPGEESSPFGPRFQERWADPAAFAAEARPCGAAAPGRPWQTVTLVAAIVAAAALGFRVVRRARFLQSPG